MTRIKFLDGFRGLAILLVIFYHVFTRWTEIVPYGDRFSSFFLFNAGWTGVLLFFLISGFVIAMTLDKCRSLREFFQNRWLRLFPGMLIATTIIVASATLFPERPRGIPRIADTVSGLLFIEPVWLQKLFHFNQDMLEGSFWSLFVEAKFYVIFALLYFYFGKKKAIAGLTVLFVSVFIIDLLYRFFPNTPLRLTHNLFGEMSFYYFGWFASGAYFYQYFVEHRKRDLLLGTVIGIASAGYQIYFHHQSIAVAIMLVAILFIFIATICSKKIQKLFENRVLLFTGFLSYPLYLLHENMLVSMTVQCKKAIPSLPDILTPVIPIVLLMSVSYLIAGFLEPALKKNLRSAIKPLSRRPV